ncbi:MAG: UvrD-helicase domain-containing protein [Armatimonadota bacterium]|nr:UvrD-helicase domain-containing protein [Armatimonadota bacterium]MCX7777058.1 UvrD-helicase domain-containing protein [Armatimonadota bacterium]MDW8024873.1 UvrD-helicase domain-containing protein [Armatimonadota bacterium]
MVFPWLCDENGKPLDEWQRNLAESDDAHLLINACPGSGKTRVLVAHYLHLLMTKAEWDVGAVVAITFTKKAAAEMKERIGKVLQHIAHEVKEAWRRRARQLLDHLPEAPIGTIHSFCARLLRRFAIEANLAPSFQVLGDLQASILRRQVCER